MVENIVLGTFCVALFGFIFTGLPLLGALAVGFILFFGYGVYKGYGFKNVLRMSWQGIQSVKTIFIVFILIGMLTGLWRASGTLPYIISQAARFIRPSIFLLLAFWLNCGISFLLGTAFGTAATMGVITMSVSQTLGLPSLYTGGAILSGAYFGDRMSPVSTSALLVSVLTETDLYKNIKNMAESAFVPFIAASLIYLGIGIATPKLSSETLALAGPLSSQFAFTPVLTLPAASILFLSALKVSVKKNMLVSILLAGILCYLVQGASLGEILRIMALGYHCPDKELAHMLNGGGILSMLRVSAIVLLSASFGGIFKGTGLLQGVQHLFDRLHFKIGTFPAMVLSGIFTSMVTCNQTLAIVLTHQLCGPFINSKEQLALHLENTAVVIPPLIPWAIASATVLDSVGGPLESIPWAVYLYLIPLWGIVRDRRNLL